MAESLLAKVAPKLAARLTPGDLAAIEPGPDEDLTPPDAALAIMRATGCPVGQRSKADAA